MKTGGEEIVVKFLRDIYLSIYLYIYLSIYLSIYLGPRGAYSWDPGLPDEDGGRGDRQVPAGHPGCSLLNVLHGGGELDSALGNSFSGNKVNLTTQYTLRNFLKVIWETQLHTFGNSFFSYNEGNLTPHSVIVFFQVETINCTLLGINEWMNEYFIVIFVRVILQFENINIFEY